MNSEESTNFKDHFSGHAQAYAQARPTYPDALFDWLASLSSSRSLAWDAGCGNGQASRGLEPHFDRVLATDASAEQINSAEPSARIDFRVSPAERCPLDDASCDLVIAAQAAHWFDLERFCTEVQRVLKPGGPVVLWCYGLNLISDRIDPLIHALYAELDQDWPPERTLIEQRYRTLSFPFREFPAPELRMEVRWDVKSYLAYLRSWSAVQRHRRRTGRDPVSAIESRLLAVWGTAPRPVRWPLHFRAGRKEAS